MSFFTNLHQYVSNSVAGLGLSPRRLPTFSRAEISSTTAPVPEPVSPSMIDQGRVWKSNPPLPARTIPHLLQERSQSLKSSPVINAAASKRNSRASSLKEAPSVTTMDPHLVPSGRTQRKPKLIPTFALREIPQKSPWPLFAITGSGVQETDDSFFESFTALQWKQENCRLQALKQSPVQQSPADVSANQKDSAGNISTKELEQLYVEVIYTIRHKIGAHSTQYPHHYQEDLIRYAQTALSMEPQQHRRCQAMASEEKPPIVVLNVVVMEADGLEAKDPNGFSDPYCMLGIQPGVNSGESHHTGGEPEPEPERRNSLINLGQIERLRKNHSFRLSFRRRDNSFFSSSQSSSGRGSISSNYGGSSGGSSKEHRDSLSSVVPAKFIRATSVKTQTLTPKWNEKFKFDIDDVDSDILHLDIWDHDDEYSVLDAVSKLNEVRGVKGLGRFFKQIAQSARSGNQDDFLGSINIPIQEIPSTGVEKWYPLEGRSQRSSIQGRIRLKMWLSTREDFGNSEEDNWTDIKQQEQLYSIFIDYELKNIKDPVQWTGELSPTAQVILHQHAIQGDVTPLQSSVVRWIVISRKFAIRKFHYSLLYSLLQQIDEHWGNEQLSRDEEEALGVSLTTFIDFALSQIKKIRKLFLPNDSSMSQLDFLLRCLMFLEEMQAFRRCCPFHKAVRGEITNAVRKGTLEWFDEQQEKWLGTDPISPSVHITGLVAFVNAIYADLDRSLQVYNDIFMNGCGLSYFTAVYKSHVKMINESIPPMLEIISSFFGSSVEAEDLVSEVFELYTALQDLQKFQDAFPKDESQVPQVLRNYYQSFRMPLEQWLILARSKAHGRIRSAVHLDSLTTVDSYYQHSTSAIDATSCFYQICEFWKQLNWPISAVPYPFVYGIAEIICSSANLYADLISHRPQSAGHYLDDISESPLNDELFVAMNNLEHVKTSVNKLPQDLQISSVVASVDSALYVENQRSPVQSRARSPSIISHSPGTSTLLTGLSTYESSARHTFHTLFETFNEHYESKLQKTVSAVTEKMRSELRKNLFHLAWSPDSLPVDQSVAPLLEYLDQQLSMMQPALSPPAFQRCVLAIWDLCLCELWNHAEASAGEKFCAFYERLYNGLEVLLYFLHGDGKGAPLDTLRSSMYLKVNEKIWLHKTSTEHLIDSYYARRLEEQLQLQQQILHNTPYGILSIRAYFHYDTLYIEILSAKDVIPLDPNGLSDPFVIVELLPRRIFDSCSERQTAVHRKTLHPVFDECFEFHVTLEQCKMDSAFILLTVMDYDVLTANDFAGEAFLSLKSVPGIATGPHSLDTLRGLKPTDLVLMQQQQKNHPIIAVLETRKWDRQAQDFVRKQKERIAS